MQRPDPSEHAPYYGTYIALVPETDVLAALEHQTEETLAYLRALPPSAGAKRYAPGKWTVCEVLGHMIDTERVFAGRALFFARKAPGALPGMEQNDWAALAHHAGANLHNLASEFEHARRSHILMLRHLPEEAWSARGTASGVEFTVRSLAFMLVGHERHHLKILKEQYLP
jgi:uncharacterized damage-inducible protein DinB